MRDSLTVRTRRGLSGQKNELGCQMKDGDISQPVQQSRSRKMMKEVDRSEKGIRLSSEGRGRSTRTTVEESEKDEGGC